MADGMASPRWFWSGGLAASNATCQMRWVSIGSFGGRPSLSGSVSLNSFQWLGSLKYVFSEEFCTYWKLLPPHAATTVANVSAPATRVAHRPAIMTNYRPSATKGFLQNAELIDSMVTIAL